MHVILALGSNVGDRQVFLQSAITALAPAFSNVRLSPVYESASLLPHDAPADWDKPFLNMVMEGSVSHSPLVLLDLIKKTENTLGRKDRGRWAPREIDIDIIAYASAVIHLPGLSIPHEHMLERDFVLKPLADLLPDWKYPALKAAGKTAKELSQACKGDAVRISLAFHV